MFIKIITTVFCTICVAAIFALIKSRWLYIIAPKLYLYTPISDGQIVTLTVYNAGLLAEEDIAITLRPNCKYELIATSKSTITINGQTISINKLSRLETLEIVLLFEGSKFDHSDIESIESKSNKGKVVEKKEQASAPWQSIVGVIAIVLFLFFPFIFGTYVGSKTKTSAVEYITYKLDFFGTTKELANFKEKLKETHGLGGLKGGIEKKYIKIGVSEIVRRGDVLDVFIKIENKYKGPLIVDGYLETTAGDGPLGFSEHRVDTFGMPARGIDTVMLKAYLPEALPVKLIDIKFVFKNTEGDQLGTSQILEFK
ncbi:hypothetical protein [Gilvimarinus japonicus]|uniref:Uncharacterized protein n=1 Tax=Gilvimarinus japonicus TaxID=1796469 RepID=A0ABV7HV76_9GAMM